MLLRGICELKKIQLATVTKPKVIAGKMITSLSINNIDMNSNFDIPLQKLDVVHILLQLSFVHVCSYNLDAVLLFFSAANFSYLWVSNFMKLTFNS